MLYWNRCPLKRLDASTALPVSTSAVTAKKCCPLRRRLQPETQKPKQLKPNTLPIVNFALLCSYPLGMTCHSQPDAVGSVLFDQGGTETRGKATDTARPPQRDGLTLQPCKPGIPAIIRLRIPVGDTLSHLR
jgi:hypothetical protein